MQKERLKTNYPPGSWCARASCNCIIAKNEGTHVAIKKLRSFNPKGRKKEVFSQTGSE